MKLEISKTEGFHKTLALLAGKWKGRMKTWFEADKLADDAEITGSMKLILSGRFIMHEYQSKVIGQDFEGVAIYGIHLGLNKFQCAWVDSFHMGTGIMFSEGQSVQDGYNVLGNYEAPDGSTWGWRTEIRMDGPDHVLITAYNISPDGEAAKATEIDYTRVN